MLSIKRGLDCYQAEALLNKPYGYNSTHVIVNTPNDLFVHRFNIKLCSKGAQIKNPTFKLGDLGVIVQGIAMEKALLSYLGFFALTCREKATSRGEINKQKLYNLRTETDHGFDRFSSDFNNAIVWHLQSEWYQNHSSIIALHNFVNSVFNQVLGCGVARDPLSPIKNRISAAKPLMRMDGAYEKEQFRLLTELKNFVTKQLRFNHPKLIETFYSYKPYTNNRGIFVEIDVFNCCQFDKVDQVVHNLLDSRKGTFFQKLFWTELPLGVDLISFYRPIQSASDFTFGKDHPNDLLLTEREIGFMSLDEQLKLRNIDDFSSSDDEDFMNHSPIHFSSRQKQSVNKDLPADPKTPQTKLMPPPECVTPSKTTRKRKRSLAPINK